MAAAPAKLQIITKKDYEALVPRLRERLIQMQVELKSAPFPVLLVIAGLDGAGKGEVVNTLNAWLDPRGVETFAFGPRSDEERERPPFWRYWRALPPRGRMGIYYSSWHTEAVHQEIEGKTNFDRFDLALRHCASFEKNLADDHALIVKIWLHISKRDQRKRFHELEENPRTAWRVTDTNWESHALYDRMTNLADRMIRSTHRPGAPWTILDGSEERARDVAVAEILLKRFREHTRNVQRLLRRPTKQPKKIAPLRPSAARLLAKLPVDLRLSAAAYDKRRDKLLGRLNRLFFDARAVHRSVVLVFEGWDAAGKGGAIRRLTSAIDAPFYRVIPIAAPTDEEKLHHYLWRFWRHLPRAGMVTVYDRSWYGRVLVERIEGFAREEEWSRAYSEINDFEAQLAENGIILVKVWMHISKDEQLRRFRDREQIAYKRHKINDEDWRNRRRWHAYEVSVGDMLALTHTETAPWNLVPANDKRFARLEILRIACEQIEKALAKD
ncbi:MAG TPA: polyphosphate:AMP phosphotransferase [Opitutaceae bacterium]|nr:polyphosphate:AMP phosphotransferase [Opitutaceae bacterium]